MKPIEEMTGSERAAALLIALGSDVAAEILKNLDEDSINTLSREIAKIDKLAVGDKEELIGQFMLELRNKKKATFGGENVAKDILVSAFGDEKAEEILHKLTRKNLEKGFDFLKEIDSELLTAFLQNEHPQTIAVTLAHLPSEKSAKILQELASETAKEVAKRMARMDKTSPEAVIEIARVIWKKYENMKSSGAGLQDSGGIDKLASILNYMSGDHEKRLMDHFDIEMPKVSKEIRNKIYTFENILNLTHQEIRLLVDELGDDLIIAKAIKGAGDEIRFKILRNMSRNRATDVLSESEAMGPLRLSDITAARDEIVQVMKKLNDEGMITIRKDKEKLVE